MPERKTIYVGSRKSQLALVQTEFVIKKLKELHHDLNFLVVKIDTFGDNVLDKALPKIGEKSAFTKELEIALEKEQIDIVVHSLKDLPTTLPQNMVIGSVLERVCCEDVVIINSIKHSNKTLLQLPKGRGNLNTRMKKLDEGHYDAIILAAAGLLRLNWQHRITQVLDSPDYYYAVGQGVLAVECLQSRRDMIDLLDPLTHIPTLLTVLAERSFLKTIQGGCSAPVGVRCTLEGRLLAMRGMVSDLDANETLFHSCDVDLIQDYAAAGTAPTYDSRPLLPGEDQRWVREPLDSSGQLEIRKESDEENTTVMKSHFSELDLGCRDRIDSDSPTTTQADQDVPLTITDIHIRPQTLKSAIVLNGRSTIKFLPDRLRSGDESSHQLFRGLSHTCGDQIVPSIDTTDGCVGSVTGRAMDCFVRAQLCGQRLARDMIARGADLILKKARQQCDDQPCDDVL